MERLILAEESSDLSEAHGEALGDVDYLRAAGAVAQNHSLALLLWRVVDGNMKGLHALVTEVMREATRLGIEDVERVSVSVVDRFIRPACPACYGRGKKVFEGAPVLSDDPCGPCAGGGIRLLDPEALRLYDRVSAISAAARGEISRKLGR